MKNVPLSFLEFRFISLKLISGVCVGCARPTKNIHTQKMLGYANAFFQNVKYCLCEECEKLENERNDYISEAYSKLYRRENLIYGIITAFLLSVSIIFGAAAITAWPEIMWIVFFGIAAIIPVIVFVWSLKNIRVNLSIGTTIKSRIRYISEKIAESLFEKRIFSSVEAKWRDEYPEFPDLHQKLLDIDTIDYFHKKDKEKRSMYVLQCKCNAYADLLMKHVEEYQTCQDALDGDFSIKEYCEHAKKKGLLTEKDFL